MRHWKTTLSGLAFSALALTGTAAAQDSHVLNDQVQLGDVWADLDVVVTDTVEGDATGVTSAVGNTYSAVTTDQPLTVDSTQTASGDVLATTDMDVYYVEGVTHGATSAYGNALTTSTCCGTNTTDVVQTATGDVQADTTVIVGHTTDSIAVTTTAAANLVDISADTGDIYADIDQRVEGDVRATSDVDMCCNHDTGIVTTTAAGNLAGTTGTTSTTYTSGRQVVAPGASIQATTDVYSTIGFDITAGSTASGNSITVHNEWGYATLGQDGDAFYQENQGTVRAETFVTLDDWYGATTASAYGVGNSALISNIGSDAGLYGVQVNHQTVDAYASLTGSSVAGGTGYVNATAIGNAMSGYVCTTCADAGIAGTVSQTNYADVRAQGVITTTGATGGLFGSATAVGNTASFRAGDH